MHPERLEDALAQEIRERLVRGAGDEDAEHVGAGVVHPSLAGLVDERQRTEPAHPLVRRGDPSGSGWTLSELQLRERVADRGRTGRGQDDPERPS